MTSEDFLESLRQDFLLEAGEYLDQMQEVLLHMEETLQPDREPAEVELIYRITHSLKGAARSVNLPLIEQLCMSLEEVWKKIRNGSLGVKPEMFEVFNSSVDLLRQLLDEVRNGNYLTGPYQVEALRKRVEALLTTRPGIPSLLHEELSFTEQPVNPPAQHAEATAESELITDEVQTKAWAEAAEISQPVKSGKMIGKGGGDMVRVPEAKLEYLLSEVEELIALHKSLDDFERQLELMNANLRSLQRQFAQHKEYSEEIRAFELLNNELARRMSRYTHEGYQHKSALLHHLQQLLMFPMSEVFDVLPRMVRDIAKSKKKQVNLAVEGDDTRVDRRIIEGIKDPLIHLMRNAVDHGIEAPEQRLAFGKPAAGQLKISARINGEGKLQIVIADDGRGLHTQRLKERAVSMKLISQEQANLMDESEVHKLIFVSGLSTTTQTSDISGHGLGMSIVLEKIEALSGSILVKSESGNGTTFSITLPRVLSLFRGILVREYEYYILVPIPIVHKAMRMKGSQIRQLGAMPVIDYMNETVPVIRLSQLLNLPHKTASAERNQHYNMLIIRSGTRTVVLQLGEVVGEVSGVVRPFEHGMGQSDYFAGAVILTSGQIAFVLRSDVISDVGTKAAVVNEPERVRHLLVVEDSLTIRNLLRNILETAGYQVTTANDGLDAVKKLEKGSFDAVVSDIEMPRMNGFELTRKIRNYEQWKFMPIVLVTSLESEDDKRKGMEAGASAYVTKRDFEKGNLLQILDHLLV